MFWRKIWITVDPTADFPCVLPPSVWSYKDMKNIRTNDLLEGLGGSRLQGQPKQKKNAGRPASRWSTLKRQQVWHQRAPVQCTLGGFCLAWWHVLNMKTWGWFFTRCMSTFVSFLRPSGRMFKASFSSRNAIWSGLLKSLGEPQEHPQVSGTRRLHLIDGGCVPAKASEPLVERGVVLQHLQPTQRLWVKRQNDKSSQYERTLRMDHCRNSPIPLF